MTTPGALVWTILALGMASTTTATMAHTYDPNYPVCLQSYARDGYIDCSFTLMSQCNVTVSGRGATCYANPYFAPRVQPPAALSSSH
jgi:hypothetical protein